MARPDIPLKDTKHCGRCSKTKKVEEFGVRKRRTSKGEIVDKKQVWCKTCMCSYQREKKYSLTPDEINEILGRGCETCGTHENLCIDHDHNTGEVRGCLCDWCNRALGLLNDDAEQVRRLAEYRGKFNG